MVLSLAIPLSPELARAGLPVTVSKLYWASCCDVYVHRANLDGSSAEELFHTAGGGIPRLAYDPTEVKLYFPSFEAGGIQRSNLDGSDIELVVGVESPIRIALDPVRRKLYWAETYDQRQIWRSNLDGSDREFLINNSSSVTALEVDPLGGHLYWAEFADGVMRRANLEDLQAEVILDRTAFLVDPWPTGLAIDPSHGFIYASDIALNAIVRVDLDGGNPVKLITQGVVSPRAIALDPVGERIYWSNIVGMFGQSEEYWRYIMSAKLDGTDVRKEFLPLSRDGYPFPAYDMTIIRAPVPEPSSVFLVGIVAISILAKSRRIAMARRCG
jgi:sugar lactone lactonase YvrE